MVALLFCTVSVGCCVVVLWFVGHFHALLALCCLAPPFASMRLMHVPLRWEQK